MFQIKSTPSCTFSQNWPFKSHNHSSGNIYLVLISEKAVIFNVSQLISGQPLARSFYAKFTCNSIAGAGGGVEIRNES